jgi:hypothetical protein
MRRDTAFRVFARHAVEIRERLELRNRVMVTQPGPEMKKMVTSQALENCT